MSLVGTTEERFRRARICRVRGHRVVEDELMSATALREGGASSAFLTCSLPQDALSARTRSEFSTGPRDMGVFELVGREGPSRSERSRASRRPREQ